MKRSETRGLTSKVKLPKDRYAVQCMEAKVGHSKKGNIMVTAQFQIVEGSDGSGTITIDGEQYDIAGTNINQPMYLTTKVKDEATGEWDAERTQKACDRFVDFLFTAGLIENPSTYEFDESNPPTIMVGKVIDTMLYAEEYQQRKDPTEEQKKTGKPGDPILDDSGQPVIGYTIKIGQVLGPSKAEAMPY